MKKIIKTTVIAAGVLFGCGEGILHSLFKEAWHNAPSLPIYGELKGKNQVPTTHVRDLAQMVQNACDTRPEVRYILAVTGSQTQQELVECISKSLTSGKTEQVPPGNTTDHTDNQTAIKILSSDFPHLAGKYITQSMKITWTAEEGFAKAVNKVVNEYKILRNLLPIKVDIVGPPSSGKTKLAKKIAEFYKLHHIVVDDVVSKALEDLTLKANPTPKVQTVPRTEQPPNEEGAEAAAVELLPPEVPESQPTETSEEEEEAVKGAKQLLADIDTEKAVNNGVLPVRFVIRFLREKLLSKPCQNQGWVLDGFPNSYASAQELFSMPEEGEEAHEEENEEPEEEEQKESSENEEVIPVDKRIFPGKKIPSLYSPAVTSERSFQTTYFTWTPIKTS